MLWPTMTIMIATYNEAKLKSKANKNFSKTKLKTRLNTSKIRKPEKKERRMKTPKTD